MAFQAFYLGQFSSIDRQENNQTAEQADVLLGETIGGLGDPLVDNIVDVNPIDRGGYNDVLDQSSNSSSDRFEANIGQGPSTFRFDAAVAYEVTLTFTDGTTLTTTVVIFQATNGHTFMTPALSASQTDPAWSKPIAGVTIDSVVTDTAIGLSINRPDIEIPACFTPGTLIDTIKGRIPIEALDEGDLVWTLDNGYQLVRGVAVTEVPALGPCAPIRFAEGVLGNDEPLLVSPQHRMFLTGWQAELYFGEPEVLIPAVGLVNGTSITREPGGMVTYIHLLFDRHEIVRAGGALSESYFLSPAKFQDDRSAAEIRRLFPHLADRLLPVQSARPQVKRREAEALRDLLIAA